MAQGPRADEVDIRASVMNFGVQAAIQKIGEPIQPAGLSFAILTAALLAISASSASRGTTPYLRDEIDPEYPTERPVQRLH